MVILLSHLTKKRNQARTLLRVCLPPPPHPDNGPGRLHSGCSPSLAEVVDPLDEAFPGELLGVSKMPETTHSAVSAKFLNSSNQTTTMLQDNETISPSPMAKSSVIESIRVCSSKQTSPATEIRNLPSPATSASHATTDSDDASLKDFSPFKRLNSSTQRTRTNYSTPPHRKVTTSATKHLRRNNLFT